MLFSSVGRLFIALFLIFCNFGTFFCSSTSTSSKKQSTVDNIKVLGDVIKLMSGSKSFVQMAVTAIALIESAQESGDEQKELSDLDKAFNQKALVIGGAILKGCLGEEKYAQDVNVALADELTNPMVPLFEMAYGLMAVFLNRASQNKNFCINLNPIRITIMERKSSSSLVDTEIIANLIEEQKDLFASLDIAFVKLLVDLPGKTVTVPSKIFGDTFILANIKYIHDSGVYYAIYERVGQRPGSLPAKTSSTTEKSS